MREYGRDVENSDCLHGKLHHGGLRPGGLGDGCDVRNVGVNVATLLRKTLSPYCSFESFNDAILFHSDKDGTRIIAGAVFSTLRERLP